jgi:hypothetical protein
MRKLLLTGFVVAIGVMSGVAAYVSARPNVEGWREIAWPFPRDGWPAGRAFRCDTALCGGEIELYLRPKAGFCNCDTGVADDDEVDRVADLDLLSPRFRGVEPGKEVHIAGMPGRIRPMIFRCPAARVGSRLEWRCRGVAIFWLLLRTAVRPSRACGARRWIFWRRTPWRTGSTQP